MKGLTPLVSERFAIRVILWYHYLPRVQLKQLVAQIVKATKKKTSICRGLFYTYSPIAYTGIRAFYDQSVTADMTPAQSALHRAQWSLMSVDMDETRNLIRELSQHYPLEAIAVFS